MFAIRTLPHLLHHETGLRTLLTSCRDTKILCVQRFARNFAYGQSTLILVHFLTSLGMPESRVGLFMTLTLLGDVVLSFLLTLIADGIGRRNVLIGGAVLMVMSGLVFAFVGNYWILLLASVVGVISPRFVSFPISTFHLLNSLAPILASLLLLPWS